MRITTAMFREIKRGARKHYGPIHELRIGWRVMDDGTTITQNGLLWKADADLYDNMLFDGPEDVREDHELPRCALLDVYCYSADRSREWVELEGNLYVTIKDGAIVDMHNEDLNADNRATKILGRPYRNQEV